MQLNIAYKEMASTEALQAHIEEKAKKLERFLAPDEVLNFVVCAKSKGQRHSAEVWWHDNRSGKDIKASSEGHNLYEQIEECIAKAYKQARDHHDKYVDSKRRAESPKKIGL